MPVGPRLPQGVIITLCYNIDLFVSIRQLYYIHKFLFLFIIFTLYWTNLNYFIQLVVVSVFRQLLKSLLTIVAAVDLHFRHESELPVCWGPGLEHGSPVGEGQLLTTTTMSPLATYNSSCNSFQFSTVTQNAVTQCLFCQVSIKICRPTLGDTKFLHLACKKKKHLSST